MQAVNSDGRQLRALAIHDISCIGKCSLTVALPMMSAAGIETAIIPTAVLSTHTGGFEGFTYRDLTDDIMPIVEHWKCEDMAFDAVYIGYLGSERQIDIMKDILNEYNSALAVIDPVMGDNGKLYATFDESYPALMLELCKQADIITPNITEAVLMLGEEYTHGPYTQEYIECLIKRLGEACNASVVLTGVYFDENELGAAVWDNDKKQLYYTMAQKLSGFYHGTGDVFASSFVAAMMLGKTMECSAHIAVETVRDSIMATVAAPQQGKRCYGVNFEAVIPSFIARVKNDII
ncbi:MAG: pyridoxamine kinase [Clostridiales bacterium]|nr:pyridoxamine kinase [Clostridiales bacterium]